MSAQSVPRSDSYLDAAVVLLSLSFLFAVSFWLAFWARFDFAVPAPFVTTFWLAMPVVVGAKLIVFYALIGTHRGWWRSHATSFHYAVALACTAVVAFFVIAMLDRFFDFVQIPRAVVILDAICTAAFAGLATFSWGMTRRFWAAISLD